MKREKQQDTEAQATLLLVKLNGGDPDAVVQWADLAEREGWPICGYPSWAAWLDDVRADLLERQLTATAERLTALEALPLQAGLF